MQLSVQLNLLEEMPALEIIKYYLKTRRQNEIGQEITTKTLENFPTKFFIYFTSYNVCHFVTQISKLFSFSSISSNATTVS
jgi:hypothetical protein